MIEEKKQYIKKIKTRMAVGDIVTRNDFEQALENCEYIKLYGDTRDRETYSYIKSELLFDSPFKGLSL